MKIFENTDIICSAFLILIFLQCIKMARRGLFTFIPRKKFRKGVESLVNNSYDILILRILLFLDLPPTTTSPAPSLSAQSLPSLSSLPFLQSDHPTTKQLFTMSKKFQLVCCMGGIPQLSHPQLVRNFTFQSVQYVVIDDHEEGENNGNTAADQDPAEQGCRLFKGSFLLPQPGLLFGLSVELSYAAYVVCKCPEHGLGHALDRQCRRLPNCLNNGFRSLLDPRRCFCLGGRNGKINIFKYNGNWHSEPFFGDRCEKMCDRGRRIRGMFFYFIAYHIASLNAMHQWDRNFCDFVNLYINE